ncbi:hypothetical protein REPUB_Repub17cG0008300 [Reevesia pubescens]
MADKEPEGQDELAESLNDLFTSLSSMVKSELQGTNNILELLEKMNLKVAEEYKGFGDVASGLRVFVEQLKNKSGNFDEYVQQIDAIEQQKPWLSEASCTTSSLAAFSNDFEDSDEVVTVPPPNQMPLVLEDFPSNENQEAAKAVSTFHGCPATFQNLINSQHNGPVPEFPIVFELKHRPNAATDGTLVIFIARKPC